jgi:hypothetical protein
MVDYCMEAWPRVNELRLYTESEKSEKEDETSTPVRCQMLTTAGGGNGRQPDLAAAAHGANQQARIMLTEDQPILSDPTLHLSGAADSDRANDIGLGPDARDNITCDETNAISREDI